MTEGYRLPVSEGLGCGSVNPKSQATSEGSSSFWNLAKRCSWLGEFPFHIFTGSAKPGRAQRPFFVACCANANEILSLSRFSSFVSVFLST
jgi:hypothetical protein